MQGIEVPIKDVCSYTPPPHKSKAKHARYMLEEPSQNRGDISNYQLPNPRHHLQLWARFSRRQHNIKQLSLMLSRCVGEDPRPVHSHIPQNLLRLQ